jgi:glycosyltransferase involved in cell wall biosynthesis
MSPARGHPRLVSVVVPVRDAGSTLGGQLDALARQDYRGEWELVVADNGSGDSSARLARAWVAEHGLGRLVDASGRRGPGHARNVGARAARGDLLAFCDADDVVTQGWLSALVATAESADLVTGPHSGERLNPATVGATHDIPVAGEPFHGFLPMASGSNCGVWADVFHALGGFDERSRTGEDVAFSWRVQLAGYTFAVADGALVHKRFRPRPRELAVQYWRYGIGDAWLFSEFRYAGMPRRSVGRAWDEWRQVARGLPALEGTPQRRSRVVLMAALGLGRIAGSVRHGVLFP